MKCLILFSEKIKKKITNLSSAESGKGSCLEQVPIRLYFLSVVNFQQLHYCLGM